MSLHHNALLAESILFFNLGACFAIHEVNPLELVYKKRTIFLTFWIAISLADITHSIIEFYGSFYVHRLSLITNIFAFIMLTDSIVKGDRRNVNSFLAGSVFWIFATHDHLAIALRRFCMTYWGNVSDITHVFLYWTTFIIVVALCLLSYAVMKHLFPTFVNLATGNRTK